MRQPPTSARGDGAWSGAPPRWEPADAPRDAYPPRWSSPGAAGRGLGHVGAGKANPRGARRRAAYAIVAVVSLLVTLCGGTGVVTALRLVDARAAAADARRQVGAVEAALRGGQYLQPAALAGARGHLFALDSDIRRIQGDLPPGWLTESTGGLRSLAHTLRLGADLTVAGERAVDAAQVLVPHLGALLSGVDSAPAAPAPGGAAPVTAAEIAQAAADVAAAAGLVRAAASERTGINDGDLAGLGLASLVPPLHQLDAELAPMTAALGDAHTVLAALPALLGISKPARFLLLDLDSDELRPTGGFPGNYGVITLAGGRISGGVHLHDIYTLDCAGGCPYNPVPDRFSWFTTAGNLFALRDSTLDPDYPTSARLAEQLFTAEGGPPVNGVVSITPSLIQQVLGLTGPIRLAPFGVTVTASNLRDEIHYFHIINGTLSPTLGATYDTSTKKAVDAALGDALLHKVATLDAAHRSALLKVLTGAVVTRDLQVYFNDARVQGLLAAHRLDGAVAAVPGDSLMVVDTNDGVSYANQDVTEQVTDHVTLDAAGTATHDLTVTYHYPVVRHLYSAMWWAWHLSDFVRVIVPARARLGTVSGCAPDSGAAPEAGHAVWACQIELERPGDLSLHFGWTVPHATVAGGAHGTSRYTLLLQRQAGARDTDQITITAPPGRQLIQPVRGPLKALASGEAWYLARQTENEQLVLDY